MSRRDTLEAHGVRWRFNFLEAVPDVNWTPEPQWAESDLTPAHLAELDALIEEHLAERPSDGREFVRYAILEHNGVQHAHVRGRRYWLNFNGTGVRPGDSGGAR